MTENNEQEIYLRPYLTGLWNKRYWLIGLGLLGVMLGLAISYLVAPTYEATALVASTLPRERIEFDSRIQTIADSQPLQAYPELALSDTVLVELLDHISVEPSLTLTQLRKIVTPTRLNLLTRTDRLFCNLSAALRPYEPPSRSSESN